MHSRCPVTTSNGLSVAGTRGTRLCATVTRWWVHCVIDPARLLALLWQNGCGDHERPETEFLAKQHLLPSLANDQADDVVYEQAMQVPVGLRPELLARTLKLFHDTSWENAQYI